MALPGARAEDGLAELHAYALHPMGDVAVPKATAVFLALAGGPSLNDGIKPGAARDFHALPGPERHGAQ